MVIFFLVKSGLTPLEYKIAYLILGPIAPKSPHFALRWIYCAFFWFGAPRWLSIGKNPLGFIENYQFYTIFTLEGPSLMSKEQKMSFEALKATP